jgi:hypothetical protein
MLYWEIVDVCSQIHTKHTKTLRVQTVQLLNVKLAVHLVTTECYRICPCVYFKCRALSFHSVSVGGNMAEGFAKTSTCLS